MLHLLQLPTRDGLDRLLTRLAGAVGRDRPESNAQFLANRAGEKLVEVGGGIHLLALDGDHLVADAQAGLIGRTLGEDCLDRAPATRAGRVGEVDTEIPGGRRGGGHRVGRAAAPEDAEMARIELSQHLPDHVVELVLVLGIDRHVAILLAHLLPVDAVHLGVVEAVAEGHPGLVEEVGELFAHVHVDRAVERHLLAVLNRSGRGHAVDLFAAGGPNREVDEVATRAPARGGAIPRELHRRTARGAHDEHALRRSRSGVEDLIRQQGAVRRPVRNLHERRSVRHAPHVAPVGVHDEDRLVALARAVECDEAPVGGVAGVVVSRVVVGQARRLLAGDLDAPDFAVAAAL